LKPFINPHVAFWFCEIMLVIDAVGLIFGPKEAKLIFLFAIPWNITGLLINWYFSGKQLK